MSAYRCPSCGTSDPLGYVRCNQSSCPDGRDPRPQSDAEVDHLRAQVASLQKELAERTAELVEKRRDRIGDSELAGAYLCRAEAAESRADTLARRVEGLEAALEMIAGKRPCIDNLMGNVDIALAALNQKDGGNG